MAYIASIYRPGFHYPVTPCTMDTVRWLAIADSLARLGHRVDLVVDGSGPAVAVAENLYYQPAADIRWDRYDAVKTEFHTGFDHLERLGGSDHPLVISKLGSVVGSRDDVPGVYFFGPRREWLYDIQRRIAAKSRFVALLTEESIGLWRAEHPDAKGEILMVPTGVSRVPQVAPENPYRDYPEKIAVYIGNLYDTGSGQRAVNILWQNRLSALGRMLKPHAIRLVVIGPGESDLLDPDCVTYLGSIDHSEIYPYMRHASVGLVLAQGDIQHNESSKLYEYLAAGLPVVSEQPVPNNHVIDRTGHGYVARFGDDTGMAGLVTRACAANWDSAAVQAYMQEHHGWDVRAAGYDRILRNDTRVARTERGPETSGRMPCRREDH